MATYLAPPLVTVALALANMSLFALASRGHLKQLPRRYPIVMAATMAVGWIAVAVIWGHCHADAGNNPDNPWDTGSFFTTHRLPDPSG
jgi:hypothetical protein